MLRTLKGLPVINWRKAGTTSSHYGPYTLGYTRATMGDTMGCDTATLSKSQKVTLSSDWSLKFDSMKLESLVIADQHAAVNLFLGLVHTARHTTRDEFCRSRLTNLFIKGESAEVELGEGGEVVTR